MKYNPLTRRHFLQGMSGSLMALPLLPSLMSTKAYAQAMQTQKYFVLVTGDHGGTGYNKDWFPAPFIDNPNSNLFNQAVIIPSGGQNGIAHIARHARLTSLMTADPGHDGGNVDNNQQRVSFVLGSFLNPYVNKMNLYTGIDGGMIYYGHSRSVSGGSIVGLEAPKTWPTIDHFLANSPNFYVDRSSISTPILNRSSFYSWTPQGVEYPSTGDDIRSIYNAIFGRYQGAQDPAVIANRQRREFLVDRVLADFNRLVSGNNSLARRISSADKNRLGQHVQHLYETERKLQNVINTCSDVSQPQTSGYNGFWTPYYQDSRFNPNPTGNGQADYENTWDMVTDLLVAGISCGATSLANLSGDIGHFLYPGDYHENIVHQHNNNRNAQLTHNRNFRWQAQHIVGNVVRKLDAIDVGNGQTMLDRGMVAFVHEAGINTHDHFSLGLVTFGSVNGFFNTGNFVDYRNNQNLGLMYDYFDPNDTITRPGIPLQRFYANVLQAFGHAPAEYRRNNMPGYGGNQTPPSYNGTRINTNRHLPYPIEMTSSFDMRLPIVTG